MYGTRKTKPGAKPSTAAKSIAHFVEVEDDITEMDDLPVRATAPDHLISDGGGATEESRGPRRSRERGPSRDRDDRRKPRRHERDRDSNRGDSYERRDQGSDETVEDEVAHDETPAEAGEAVESAADASAQTEENRPERFAQIERRTPQMQEFKPSRDGRRQRARKPDDEDGAVKTDYGQTPKKEGFFKKLLGFFSGGSATEAPSKSGQRDNDGPDGRRRRRSGSGGSRPDGRRPQGRRGRGRPEGQAGEGRAQGERSDGRRRGRSRNRNRNRNQGERRERPSAPQE